MRWSLLVTGIVVSSCAPSVDDSCTKLCEAYDACGATEAERCAKDCTGELKEAPGACTDALATLASCVDAESCTAIQDGACDSEVFDLDNSCNTQGGGGIGLFDPCEVCGGLFIEAYDGECANHSDCDACPLDTSSGEPAACDGSVKESAQAALDAGTCDAGAADLVKLLCP